MLKRFLGATMIICLSLTSVIAQQETTTKANKQAMMEEEKVYLRADNTQTASPVIVYTDYPAYTPYKVLVKTSEEVDITGTVGLSHDYTYSAFALLTDAIRSTISSADVEAPMMMDQLHTIMDNAAMLQTDLYADNHADIARRSFLMMTDVLDRLGNKNKVVLLSDYTDQMREIANNIDVNELYTEQVAHTYMFFTHAQKVVNDIRVQQTKINADIDVDITADK